MASIVDLEYALTEARRHQLTSRLTSSLVTKIVTTVSHLSQPVQRSFAGGSISISTALMKWAINHTRKLGK